MEKSTFSKALDSCNNACEALLQAFTHAPAKFVKEFIDRKASEVLIVELPKLGILMDKSPCMTTDEALTEFSIVAVFEEALSNSTETMPPELAARITATVHDAAHDIAVAMDRAVKRIALEDKFLGREAHLDLITAHTAIVAALAALSLDEEQTALAEKIQSRKPTKAARH